jgi:two-component system cell cycle sensor histidine kinase/response regulator CckA
MKHILVADDNIAMTTLVVRALPGYRITVAHNGLEALVLAKTLEHCDLLITDYLMPSLNGDQLAARLRVERPSIKTLLMTGFGPLVETLPEATDVQLSKPFDARALREKVEALIGHA